MLIIVEREYKKMSNTEMKELSLDESREINGEFSVPSIITGNHTGIKIVKSITEWLPQ